MSSINGNGNGAPYSANNDGSQASLQQLAQQSADMQARKKADKVITDSQKAQDLNILKLAGMTPTDATAEVNGTPKSNKYSAAGAVANLSAPAAPKSTITQKTQALYTSMHTDISHALGSVQSGEKAIDWSTLTPTMKAASSPAEAEKQVANATTAATNTIKQITGQYSKISSSQMTMAFLMLRSQGQQSGLNINNQMSDMQSAVRQAALNEQIKSDKEAQVKLDKAAKKQAAMKKAGPVIEAIIAVVMAAITVLSVGTATGLALVLAAMVTGFVAGGAIGGAKKGDGFDFNSAVTGLSIAEMVVPLAALMQGLAKSVTIATEKGVAAALKEASEKAVSKVTSTFSTKAEKSATTAADRVISSELEAKAAQAAQDVSKANSSKLLNKAEQRAQAQAEQATNTEAKAGAEAGEQTPNFAARAAHHMSEQFQKVLPQALKDTFSATQKAADQKLAALKATPGMPNEKLVSMMELTLFVGQFATQATQAGGNFAVQEENIKAQKLLAIGQQWGVLAKVAQGSFKDTQDFLSAMQDQHNTALTQIQQILAAKNQAASLAISHISG
jgi:hypothetical protein